MSRIEQARFEASLDDPLLVFKVGVLGSAPLDFMAELADSYGAAYFSSDEMRMELMGEKEEDPDTPTAQARNIDTREIRDRLVAEAQTALTDGQDVVIDMFFNTANSRIRTPISLAQATGAKAVALWVNTPFSLSKQRVKKWTEDDAFLIPVGQWGVPPIQAARHMMLHTEAPVELEGIDYVFKLKGVGDTESLLEKYETHLANAGLLDRYDDVEV